MGQKVNYRQTRNAYCNCNRRIYEGVGQFNIPEILPQEIDLTDPKIIGFNYAKGEDFPEEEICHFYLDDYQFDRVWKEPDLYIPSMCKFKAVLAPDFSLYDDFPMAVNVYNHYRKHWISRYWQDHGVKVIPTICWADGCLGWCFDGTPRRATISISVLGCNKGDGRDYWTGFHRAIEILEPKQILLFKGVSSVELPDCGGAEIIEVQSGNLTGAKLYEHGVNVPRIYKVK
jgi:hypothetical protein